MTSTSLLPNFQKYIPAVGNINNKSLFAYKLTRGATQAINAIQMALAEAYIHGLELPDPLLKGLLNSFLPILYKYFPALLVPYEWVLQESDRLAEAADELIKLQYDLPEEMFALMLEEDDLSYPKYSMALWEKGATSLLQAQRAMLDDVIEKANIQDGETILDLGCGWGSVAHHILAKFPNARVTGLNFSHQQCEYIRKKMRNPQSYFNSERFTLVEKDFNEAVFDNKFDKIITIGFFEHIGNLTKSFQKIADLLKDDGKVFLHIISIRLPHNAWSPFINKYIFPKARVWHYEAVPLCDRDLKTIDKWFINGSNYAKTLQSWLQNFDNNQPVIKNLNYGMDYAQFRRIWRLYLLWCIAYFSSCHGEVLGNGQYLMVKAHY
jgi:cyclopropane-fatty-acyl-phospholipid synthase